MSEAIGCGDSSCVFRVLTPGGMKTNGGCRCFKYLVLTRDDGVSNADAVHRVERDTRRLSAEVRSARESARTAREATMAVIIAKLDELMDVFGHPAECEDDPYWMGLDKAASMVRAMLSEHDRSEKP